MLRIRRPSAMPYKPPTLFSGASGPRRLPMHVVVIGLMLAVSLSAVPGPAARNTVGERNPRTALIRQVQVLEAERIGTASPVGLAYAARSGSMYVVERPASPRVATDVIRLRPFALMPDSDRAGSERITAAVQDPINMAFDDNRNRLLLLLGRSDQLLEVSTRADGRLQPGAVLRHDAKPLDVRDPQGMAVDQASGTAFFLDASGPRVVRIEPDGSGGFTRAGAFDLQPSGAGAVRGLAFDPSTNHLHVGAGKTLLELTTEGELVAVHDLSDTELGTVEGIVFAPSGDQTDDPTELSAYVADSGGARQATGQIVELSLTAVAAPAASSFTSSLVNTVDTAAWDPPSPDPSGLAYVRDHLMMVDGEVEETVSGITHFAGANLWEFSLGGTVIRTANISTVPPTTVPMTDEPTGVAFDPVSGHYFFSDDGRKRVYRLNPGPDDLVGTSDDSWNYFVTRDFGNGDPEGITYNTWNGRLFVADGVNAEIYEYTKEGALVGQFDVLSYGVEDPEGVEFNPVTGTLYVLSNRASGPIIVETTTAGALLQTIDVAAAGAHKPASVAYAPASDGSGAFRFYISDRGIDNNNDPTIVDGVIFELTAPPTTPSNAAPVITSDGGGATASRLVSENQTAVTDVDATDADGDPLTYSLVGGVDQAAFVIDSASGVLRFVSAPDFEAPGDADGNNVYVVVVGVSDGLGGSDSQQISVTVTDVDENPGAPNALYFSLRDAATVGGVSAANEDVLFFDGAGGFSLTFDGSDVGIKGLRIDAFLWLDADTLLFSFDADKSVPGIAGIVDDSDIVRFDATSLGPVTAGSFSLYFDGSDVGLTASAHDVDAVEILSDGRILLSTVGSVSVSGVSARDEDLLSFTPTSLGDSTAGTYSLFFDGSDVGLGDAGEDINAASVDGSDRIYLSTRTAFAVPAVNGADEDVFVFTPNTLGSTTSGTYAPTLYFDGSSFGLAANNIYALDLP